MFNFSLLGLRDTAKAKEWFNKTIELPVTGPAQKTQNENKVLAKARLDAINSSWW